MNRTDEVSRERCGHVPECLLACKWRNLSAGICPLLLETSCVHPHNSHCQDELPCEYGTILVSEAEAGFLTREKIKRNFGHSTVWKLELDGSWWIRGATRQPREAEKYRGFAILPKTDILLSYYLCCAQGIERPLPLQPCRHPIKRRRVD